MRVVTHRTGLSAELLRVWERRYRVVTPGRTQTGRRLYSDTDIERLRLLYRATLAGRTIGTIAALSTPALSALVRQDAEAELATTALERTVPTADPAGAIISECLRAVEDVDASALEGTLRRASIALPASTFLDTVVASLLERAGTRWRDGTLRPLHGHLVTTVVRRVLERVMESASTPGARPRLLITTPAGQTHELGALLAAAAAVAEGWSVTYLGANLPAEDIAEAAIATRARAVGLSLVYPPHDRSLGHELRRLRALLPKRVAVIVGGAASSAYDEVLDEIGAKRVDDLASWRVRLGAAVRRQR